MDWLNRSMVGNFNDFKAAPLPLYNTVHHRGDRRLLDYERYGHPMKHGWITFMMEQRLLQET